MYAVVVKAVELSAQAVHSNDQRAVEEVVASKGEVDRGVRGAFTHQAKLLREDDASRLTMFCIEMKLVEKPKQIHTLAKRIARAMLPQELAVRVE